LVACADSRYTTLSIYDLLDDWRARHHRQSPKVLPLEQRWSLARGVLGTFHKSVPADVQLNRMNSAVFESDEMIGVLMAHVDRYDYTRIDAGLRLSELAKEMDAVALSGPSVDVDCSPGAVAVPASPAGGSQGWLCMSCGQRNADTAEACTNVHANGTACDAMRKESAIPAPGTRRTSKPIARYSPGGASSGSPGGASSGSGRAPAESSGRARGGINTPARGKRKRAGARGGRPQSTPHDKAATEEPVLEDDEDALNRRSIEALVQSPDDVRKGPGFKVFNQLLLSHHTRNWARKLYIYPLRECARGEGGGPGPEPGLLLKGGPGTGKTALAEALAVEADVSFLPIGNSKVLSKWAGQADRTVAAIFAVAKQRAPCIVFFDEADKLLQNTASGSAEAHSNVTNG